jgi:hypothetical protein
MKPRALLGVRWLPVLLLLLLLTSAPMLPLALPARCCFIMGSAGDSGCR